MVHLVVKYDHIVCSAEIFFRGGVGVKRSTKLFTACILCALSFGGAHAATLESGMTGESVSELQRLLVKVGYLGRSIDGEYGSTTVKAVELFQKHHGMTITGIADDETQERIRAAVGTKGRNGGGVVLTEGNRGRPVTMYQEKLVAAGVLSDADGVYGKDTSAAVLAYQDRHGIPTSGIIDEMTRDYLDKKPVYEDNFVLVEKAQQHLIELGYLAGGADGMYGEKTRAAVSKFQKDEGLTESGRFNDATLNALYTKKAPKEIEETAETEPSREVKMTKETVGAVGSDDIRECQKKLIELGYLKDKADGILGSKTAAALKAFQKEKGIPQTGAYDEETQNAMWQSSGTEFKRGDRGTKVKRYQQRLIRTGYMSGKADGVFGAETQQAVRDFQKDNDLNVTGRLDAATIKELDEVSIGNGEMSVGERGMKVARLQNLLTLHGFVPDSMDGIFGDSTMRQLKAFQKYKGLPQTGICTDAVWDALEDDPVFRGQYKKKMVMSTTSYTPHDGGGGGHTALGNIAGKGHAAVDPDVIPLGSIIFIEGYGYAIADDIGGAIVGNIVDVGVDSLDQAYAWGTKDATVYIVE